jgi:outer membrane protein assembly factor BamB
VSCLAVDELTGNVYFTAVNSSQPPAVARLYGITSAGTQIFAKELNESSVDVWGNAAAYELPIPAIDNGVVYVTYATQQGAVTSKQPKIYAFNAYSGAQLWKVTLPINNVLYYVSSPALSDSRLFVTIKTFSGATVEHLMALDLSTQDLLWQTDVKITNPSFQIPVVGGGKVYTGGSDKLYAVYENNGSLAWGYNYNGFSITVTRKAAIDSDTVYFVDDTAYAYAVAMNTGTFKWRKSLGTGVAPNAHSGVPLVLSDRIYIANGTAIASFNADTGVVLGQTAVGSGGYNSPVLVGGKLYSSTQNVGKVDRFG